MIALASARDAAGQAPPDYRDWTDTTLVYVNTSAGGANITSGLIGFPLLVRLDRTRFDFARARGNGQDLRFTNAHGAPLPHHVERWDSAAGRAEVWVLVDTVWGDNATQHFRMYSGNPAAASIADAGAVFPASKGLVAVWHMGAAGALARVNAVAGASPAVPVNFDGDEAREGVIGLCDSLDGGAPGDYLDLGDGYADFTGGFTWSAWVQPAAIRKWSHFMELGNTVGPAPEWRGQDHIVMAREDMTDNLAVHLYHEGGAHSPLVAGGALTNGAWQHLTVTITNTDNTVRTYKNGSLIATSQMAAPLSTAHRANNWMGRSGWSLDEYFQGKLDEVRLSKVAHSASWIRLSYENQKPNSYLITFGEPPRCQARFTPPADTSVAEGRAITLAASADCALAYSWAILSGPAPRIVDPNVKALHLAAPRVAGDTTLVYEFRADFGDTYRIDTVRVRIRESIPEPAFSLPATLGWNGRDSLRIAPTVTNLAAVKASRDSVITWSWTLQGVEADTAWRPGALVLKPNTWTEPGKATLGLCLHNGGPSVCRTASLSVGPDPTAGLRPRAARDAAKRPEAPRRSIDGRVVRKGSSYWPTLK